MSDRCRARPIFAHSGLRAGAAVGHPRPCRTVRKLRAVDAPFVLLPLGDGRYEMRAFSDDSEDPIVLMLDEHDGRALSAALGELLAALDAPGSGPSTAVLTVADREVRIDVTGNGVRLTVDR